MDWHCVFLDEHQVAEGAHDCLVRQFRALYERAGNEEIALFYASHPGHGMDLFFSPESQHVARGLIEYYGGTPCEAPAQHAVHTLVGQQGARERMLNARTH